MSSVTYEEFELQNDSKYKMYLASVDKALKSFEYTSEWPDLISALGKLNKILIHHQKYPVIPRRMKISKRLAQCLHPALPSGVHLKALETYDIMFRTMGMNRLSQELFIYSSGLFPVLSHAATNVKPSLLSIYENHFVPLGEKLIPGLSGFLSGVLPGLEEGTDYYDRTNLLLEKVCSGVTPRVFYSCLWECVVSNAAVRLPAILFVLSHFDRHYPMKDQLYLMGNDVNKLVKGLCTCFQDESVLIQRSALDFLLIGFPMHDMNLSQEHYEELLNHSMITLLRRDMSLNRRLFAWLLGSDITSSTNSTVSISGDLPEGSTKTLDTAKASEPVDQYFRMHSKELLVAAIKSMLLKVTGNNPHDLRPYRILISLLDKSDIGPVILDDILFEVFRLLYLCCQNPGISASNGSELLKSANLLFGSLEPRYLWQYVGELFLEACCRMPTSCCDNLDCDVKPVNSGDPSLMEVCSVIMFLLDSLSLEIYSDTFSEYLPELFLHVVASLTDHCDTLNAYQITASLRLCLKILSKITLPTILSPDRVAYNHCVSNNDIVAPSAGEGMIADEKLSTSTSSDVESLSENDVPCSSQKEVREKESNSSSKEFGCDYSLNLWRTSQEENESPTMEKCLHRYKKFYVTFAYVVRLKLGETRSVSNLFKCLLIKSPQIAAEDKAKRLELLLFKILRESGSGRFRITSSKTYDAVSKNRRCECDLENNDCCCLASLCSSETAGLEWQDPISYASKLLIELSTFQMSVSTNSSFRDTFKKSEKEVLPDWLKSLIVNSCWLGNTSVPLQMIAISTLLDLCVLCRRTASYANRSTVGDENLASSSSIPKSEQVVTVVVFVPLLTLDQLSFIEQHTNVFQVIIHWLWLHLGNATYEVKCAELLCQLQNALHLSDLIERCIGESLSVAQSETKRFQAFKKFFKLWHISREINTCNNYSSIDNSLYRCMLKVLDNLHSSNNYYLKLETENWLFHSLLRGDCRRIIEPLLLILLDHKTARIGVSYANIQLRKQSQQQQRMLDCDANEVVFSIYATHGGAVAYHVLKNTAQTSTSDHLTISSMDSNALKIPLRANETANSQEGINRESPPAGDVADVSEKSMFSFDLGSDSLSSQKYNTLPLTKEKLFRSDSDKKFGSYSSLENLEKDESSSLWDEGSQCSASTIDLNSTKIKITRTSVSDDGLAMEDGSAKSVKDVELIRSSSFSGTNTSTAYDKDRPQPAHRNEISNLLVAKTVVEEIIKEIIDQVVSGKNSEYATALEKEEEGDSAISCNSGCSSVTLEYDKDQPYYFDDEEDPLSRKKYPHNLDVKASEKTDSSSTNDQFYSHMLLYCSVYDQERVLYIFNKFRHILRVNAKAFLFLTSTSNVSSSQTSLVNLLVKHRNSIFAKGFQCDGNSSESVHKSTSYLEVVITVCFYYVRSYYPNFGEAVISNKEIYGNKQVQLESVELLTQIFFQLCRILPQSEGEIFLCVRQLLNRCKVQKITLHSIWCCLLDDSLHNVHIFIKEIVDFNNGKNQLEETSSEYNQAFQTQYLRLLLSLITLENELYSKEEGGQSKLENCDKWTSSYEFVADKPIVQQPLFFNLLKKLLEPNARRRTIHERVISFVIASLQFFKRSLAKIMVSVVQLLCFNIEVASDVYVKSVDYRMKQKLPTNYMVTLMDALTVLSHYCLLDFSSQQFCKTMAETSTVKTFKGLFQMYGDFPNSTFQCSNRNQPSDYLQDARESVLHNLPKIFASVSLLWKTIAASKQNEYENDAGSLPAIRSQILNLLNPIATHHSTHFIFSVAVVWKEKMVSSNNHLSNLVLEANKDQLVLVQLLSSLVSVTPEVFINSIYRIIKPQISSTQNNKEIDIEISALEMLVHYIQIITVSKLTECWNFLALLLREASNVSVQSQFLLCSAVNHFVRRLPSTPDYAMDKKDFKDLQDIIIKLVEIITQIAGACLEQTTWLRRNLAVRDNNASVNAGVLSTGILFGKDTDKQSGIGAQYSVHAQLLLADVLIPLLDLTFCSTDKEKLVVILINVMYNITPYLKNHTRKNSNNFYACSQVLATIASYQYTKKAWKKDVMDLLLDSSLFQMEVRSLKHWRTIVANLMCQETSTFRDLLGRVSVTQNNALNLFSSKEQEYEQRSQLLKRLAFGILCCEHDQFHKHMPDIQEKLAESLKLPQSTPGVQTQVFLCFRVLLLRMSPHHVTSLWPVIITELVQVMLQMEYELSADVEESGFQNKTLSSPDWPWMSGTCNGVLSNSHPHWLQLQVAAAKLLKLAVQLPANRLPQFQMYRWAFVGNYNQSDSNCVLQRNSTINSDSNLIDFVPHVTRVASLMNSKYGKIQKARSDKLLPSTSDVKTLQDLHLFFLMLSEGRINEVDSTVELENEIELDFVEQLPFTSTSGLSK